MRICFLYFRSKNYVTGIKGDRFYFFLLRL